MSSEQTFSREATLREVRVMRILWIFWGEKSVSGVLDEELEDGGLVVVEATYGTLAELLLGLLVGHLGGG